ncbi:MAG: helix-turn-helix domain-containing protein [Gammaproteobacteria bacterium]
MSEEILTIGRLSSETGCKVETIRYYEQIGLLHVPQRTMGGHRIYRSEDINRLYFILRSRELGFTIAEIRILLGLVDGGYTCGEVKALTDHHITMIAEKISDLELMMKTLSGISRRCKGGKTPECPIIESLSMR